MIASWRTARAASGSAGIVGEVGMAPEWMIVNAEGMLD